MYKYVNRCSVWPALYVDTYFSRNREEIEPFPLEIILPKLYNVSVKAAKDNDKVKCNAVRAVGSILYLCPQKHILSDTTLGLDVLINCAVLGNDMKVSSYNERKTVSQML